jgi:deoxyadenosine/deoxycytidine kinase
MEKFFVAIAGNVGVGKSTLTNRLAARLGWTPFYEAVDDNPYLSDFYQGMRAWSFHSQIYFLSRRLRHHHTLLNHPNSVVQDRTVYEDAEVFARNLYQQGNMVERDYRSYRELYEVLTDLLPPPDLIIYLQARLPTLVARIQNRGRDFERGVSPLYLQQLNELYDAWVDDFRLCPILAVPAEDYDFLKSDRDVDLVIERLRIRLAEGKSVAAPA